MQTNVTVDNNHGVNTKLLLLKKQPQKSWVCRQTTSTGRTSWASVSLLYERVWQTDTLGNVICVRRWECLFQAHLWWHERFYSKGSSKNVWKLPDRVISLISISCACRLELVSSSTTTCSPFFQNCRSWLVCEARNGNGLIVSASSNFLRRCGFGDKSR